MQAERLVRCQHVEAERAGAVADDAPRPDDRRRGCDLAVRHSQQHDIEALSVEPASEWAGEPGKRSNQRAAQAAVTDHRSAAD